MPKTAAYRTASQLMQMYFCCDDKERSIIFLSYIFISGGVSNITAEGFPFTFPPRKCLQFSFILGIYATINKAAAPIEIPLLWDAGVNSNQMCERKM